MYVFIVLLFSPSAQLAQKQISLMADGLRELHPNAVHMVSTQYAIDKYQISKIAPSLLYAIKL
jgi:hypothetical protein